MSNFLNLGYSNLNDLVSINANDINTQTLTTTQLTTNGDIKLSGSIINGSNSITFSESTLYTNIPQNFFINGTGLIQYQGTNYNIGQVLSAFVGGGTVSPYPSITYNSGTTSFTGSLVFPSSSISSSSINNNSRFVELTISQVISNKEFSGTTIFSSLQLNSDLIVNSGGTTISNSQLALIPNISTNTTDINTLNVKNTNISYNPTGTLTTFGENCTFTNAPTLSGANISAGTVPIAKVQGVAVNLNSNQIITGIKQHAVNIRLDASLLCGSSGATEILNSTLVKINNISDTTSAVGANLTSLQTQINSINTDLDGYALQSAVQAILDDKIGTMIYFQPTDFTIVNNFLTNGQLQYTPDGTQKINLIPIITSSQDKLLNVSRIQEFNFFDINSNVHIYEKLQLGTYTDVAFSLSAVITAEGITSGFTAANTLALGTLTVTTIPAMNLVTAGIALDVTNLETDVAGLQQKTQKISYSVQDNTTTISAITSIFKLRVGDLESGLIQTENLNVRFIGVTEIRNDFLITNGFGMSIDSGINQLRADGLNTFTGALTVNNDFTSGGTNTNINSTNCKIAGLTTIKLNTQNPILSVMLPSTVGAFNAQGILIGKEQTNGQARNCNIGYNYAGDGSQDNYGYLGLNVLAGAGNLKECFRWFPTKCVITGDLSVDGNVNLVNSTITLTTGNIVSTGGDLSLTNGDLNVVNGDATFSNGSLTLGVGDISVNNGDLNVLNGEFKTNTVNKYSGNTLDVNSNGVGSILNLNSPQINIGYNQGVGAFNTINIGSTTSLSTIYLNGIVSSSFGFNLTGSVLQW